MRGLNDVQVLIVHHHRVADLLGTVHGVLAAGVPAANVLVVDTSEDAAIVEILEGHAAGWALHRTTNQGFGAAVNRGMDVLPADVPFTLVMTHETRCTTADLTAMVEALRADGDIGLVGPDTLLTPDGIWSRGGRLSRWLLLPYHRVDQKPAVQRVADVEWLDGAIGVYRSSVLRDFPFREDFFLYLEETELHTRLRRHSWRVVTVAGTEAQQSTSGMPAYWGVRNMFLFQAAQGTRLSRIVTPTYSFLRTCVILILNREWREVTAAVKGFAAGWAATSRSR